MQVVRAGPDVQGDQRPEVHDRQAIGIHRAFGLLGHVVVHHPQEACGEEEAHGVVAVPPLHHGVGGPGVDRVRLGQADRQFEVVDDVQHGHGQDEGTEEPVADIDMLGGALDQSAEEHDGVADPDDGDQDVDRPFQLGVFLGAGVTQRQGNGRQQDDQLPAPESERGQPWCEEGGLAGALHRIIGGGEQCAAAEREDHRIGMQWAQAAEAGPGEVEVKGRPGELGGDEDAEPHPDDSPHHRHDGELADHLVVIGGTAGCVHVWVPIHGYWQALQRGKHD
ncbi:hypothetical protein D3C78_346440 [compost metagenome]